MPHFPQFMLRLCVIGGFSAARARQRGWLLLCLLLFALPPLSAATSPPPLTRLALSLIDQPGPLRADLAYAALVELADAYALEAERARQEPRERSRGRDLRRWSAAVEQMANEYAALADRVTAMTEVEVRAGPDNSLHLVVGGKPVLVNGPRPREQSALEQRIIERYCSLNLCDPDLVVPGVVAGSATGTATSRTRSRVTPHWSFSQAGPICETDDGLEFQFREQVELGHKREACATIVDELQLLAGELSRRIHAGTRVDWNALAIRDRPEGELYSIRLNNAGEEIRLPLPTLADKPKLFALLRPWLAGKVKGERYHLVVINADQFFRGRHGYE